MRTPEIPIARVSGPPMPHRVIGAARRHLRPGQPAVFHPILQSPTPITRGTMEKLHALFATIFLPFFKQSDTSSDGPLEKIGERIMQSKSWTLKEAFVIKLTSTSLRKMQTSGANNAGADNADADEYTGLIYAGIKCGIINDADASILVDGLAFMEKALPRHMSLYQQIITAMIEEQLITNPDDPRLRKAFACTIDCFSEDLLISMIEHKLLTSPIDSRLTQYIQYAQAHHRHKETARVIAALIKQRVITQIDHPLITQFTALLPARLESSKYLDAFTLLLTACIEAKLITDKNDPMLTGFISQLSLRLIHSHLGLIANIYQTMARYGLITDPDGPEMQFLLKMHLHKEYADCIAAMLEAGSITSPADVTQAIAVVPPRDTNIKVVIIKAAIKAGVFPDKNDPHLQAILAQHKELFDAGEAWVSDETYCEILLALFDQHLLSSEDLGLFNQALDRLTCEQYRYWAFVEQLVSRNIITDRNNPHLQAALVMLSDIASRNLISFEEDYSKLIQTLIEQHIITDRTDPVLQEALKQLLRYACEDDDGKSAISWEPLLDLLNCMLANGLITSFEDPVVQASLNMALYHQPLVAVSLICSLVEYELFPFSGLTTPNLGFHALKMLLFSSQGEVAPDEQARIDHDAQLLFETIERTNDRAERTEQRINMVELLLHSAGLANLQFMSRTLTNGLVRGRCERGYLPLLENDLHRAAEVPPVIVSQIRTLLQKHRQATPAFLMQLVGFANTFLMLKIPPERFAEAIEEPTETKILLHLTKIAIEGLSQKMGIAIDVNDETTLASILERWNMQYFGAFVSASQRWQGEDTLLFSVVIKAALEGKFDAVLRPEEHPSVDFSNYPPEQQEQIRKVRTYNEHLLRVAQAKGLNVAYLKHPELFPTRSISARKMRHFSVLLPDFRQRYLAFDQWFSSVHLTSLGETEAQKAKTAFAKMPNALGPALKTTKATLPILENLRASTRLGKFSSFLTRVSDRYKETETIPVPLADMLSIIEEINAYDQAKYAAQPKSANIRIFRREPSRDLFVAHEVGSCTAIERNASAIFEYLADLGTIYCVIEDPETHRETGYARFFIGTKETDGKPYLFIDSADGTANGGDWRATPAVVAYIKTFAQTIGINPDEVETDRGCRGPKMGGAITPHYNTHAMLTIPQFAAPAQPSVPSTTQLAPPSSASTRTKREPRYENFPTYS